jgi:3-oxoacyl-[acyl-carrier protein] reductase
LAEAGFDICAHYHRNDAAAASLEAELRAKDQRVELLSFDVRDAAACEQALKPLVRSRPPAVLVHAAGIDREASLARMASAEWQDVLQTNLTGFFNVLQPVLRGMVTGRRGSIVAIGSVVGRAGLEGHGAYCASKAGLVGAVRSLAREMGPFGIRANVVAPGWITTDMTAGRPVEKVLPRIPLGRAGAPEEVARAVRFFCSEDASYVTGAVLDVSGGLDL